MPNNINKSKRQSLPLKAYKFVVIVVNLRHSETLTQTFYDTTETPNTEY